MLERRVAPHVSEIPFWTLVFVVLASTILGWYAPSFEAHVGLPAVDVDGASSPARTLALIAGYGSHGRQAYLVFLSLDCLLPVAASLLLLRLYYATTRAWAWTKLQRRSLVAIGTLPAIFDLIENTLYALLAAQYPSYARPLAEVAYAATVLKLASGALALLTLAVLGALWLRRRVYERRTA
jgi:hypothetical protein